MDLPRIPLVSGEPTMSTITTNLANAAVGACCLVIAGLAIRREFWPPLTRVPSSVSAHYVDNWHALRDSSSRIGPAAAPIELIEFVDFECPFCRQLASRLDSLLKKRPSDFSLTLRHFPIQSHKFARSAAMALECAKRERRVGAMYSSLMAGPDSLGLKSYSGFARDAGMSDSAAFEECIESSTAAGQVAADVALGERLGVSGTPTVIVNGWLLSRPPSNAELEAIAETVLSRGRWAPKIGDTISELSGTTSRSK